MTAAPIVEARAEDAARVIALWRACELTRPWNDPAEDFALALSSGASAVLVAREDGAIAGSVMVGFDGHRGWIYYLAVAPECRRGGLGRALMEAAEAWLRARGCPKMQLMVRPENAAALDFYAALGMKRQELVAVGKFLGAEE